MKVLVYYRVNHGRSRARFPSLDAQQHLVDVWVRDHRAEVVEEVFEVERARMRDRPVLASALDRCLDEGAVLLIAFAGELVTNVPSLRRLAHCGVKLRAADLPALTETVIPELLEVALYRRMQVGRRVRWGLELARRQGRKVGSEFRLRPESAAKGRQCGSRERRAAADRFARKMYPEVASHLSSGLSLNAIARLFNAQGVRSASGRTGVWTAAAVRNLIQRARMLGLDAAGGDGPQSGT